ncbi:hypothetical protein [Hwanghaeella sp.]|uniref:hypothetical protein n=1 Tax=Hwanghaeella sp. TaxID=2605943 RepID=UPI003CCC01CB
MSTTPNEYTVSFKERLRALLQEHRYTFDTFGDALGLESGTFPQRMKRNSPPLKTQELAAAADLLKVSVSYLVTGQEERSSLSGAVVAPSIRAALLALIADRRLDLDPGAAAEYGTYIARVVHATRDAERSEIEDVAARNAQTLLTQFEVN